MRFSTFARVGSLVAMSLLSSSALARSTGIIGRSGKPPATGTTRTCVGCHTAGTNVTVEISGPTAVEPGSKNPYTFIIRGGPAVVGGVDLSVDSDAAALEVAENSGLRKDGVELTHVSAKDFSTGAVREVRFDFWLTAPGAEGTLKIYGAGNSANGDKVSANDAVANTALEVAVAFADQPDAGSEPDGGSGEPDAGNDPGPGGEPDAGSGEPDAGTGNPDPGTGGEQPGTGHEPDPDDDKKGGCSSTGGAPLLMFVVGSAGVALLRRRRA
ncbi:MAG: MXAN_6652 family MXYO-CTERM-anchored protein [Cystobacter sp.]